MSQPQFTTSLFELCQFEDMNESIVTDLVAHSIVSPIKETDTQYWIFDSTSVYWMRKAVRLHIDLDIDWVAVSMVIDLLQEKEKLEKEIVRYQQKFERLY